MNGTAPTQTTRETVLAVKTIEIERKRFTLSRCENARGQILRIVEEFGHRRTSVIVPLTGMEEFFAAIDEVVPPPA